MAKFCQNCGSALTEGTKFCPSCGTPVAQSAQPTQQQPSQQPQQQPKPYTPKPQVKIPEEFAQRNAARAQPGSALGNSDAHMGIPSPGYSARINDTEILRAMRKSKRASIFFGIFIIPLPLIGFVIYASVTGDMEIADAVKYGLIVSAIFLVFWIFSSLKQRAQKSYEGVVTDKKILNQHYHKLTYSQRRRAGIDDTNERKESYVTYVRTTTGQVKKITEWTPTFFSAWNYLEVGDRFRYHPQLHFPYEKYDKTHETHLYCVGCLKKNPITADRCSKCGLPLLK